MALIGDSVEQFTFPRWRNNHSTLTTLWSHNFLLLCLPYSLDVPTLFAMIHIEIFWLHEPYLCRFGFVQWCTSHISTTTTPLFGGDCLIYDLGSLLLHGSIHCWLKKSWRWLKKFYILSISSFHFHLELQSQELCRAFGSDGGCFRTSVLQRSTWNWVKSPLPHHILTTI